MIHLEAVTPDNWRPGLSVGEEQKNFVADRSVILARAWAYREHGSRAFIICDDDIPVGMALCYDWEEGGSYDLSQLFIDSRYQGRGFGKEASRQLLRMMEEDGRYDRVTLCYIEGNNAAKGLYEELGFLPTGEADGDEIIMEKRLR